MKSKVNESDSNSVLSMFKQTIIKKDKQFRMKTFRDKKKELCCIEKKETVY